MFITTANTLGGDPGAAAGPHGDHPAHRLHRVREAEHRGEVPRAAPEVEEAASRTCRSTITENAIRTIIHHYTKEAGVRSLEREIASDLPQGRAARASPRARTSRSRSPRRTSRSTSACPKYRLNKKEERDEIGLTNGLAVTNSGGGELLACEVAVVPGKGKLVITGLLEKGMEESAQAAMSYVRSRAQVARPRAGFLPEGRRPRSLPRVHPQGRPVARASRWRRRSRARSSRSRCKRDLAMTGEITLRGRVLPIGGLKEKLLAAHRAGITTVVIPQENRKDLREVPAPRAQGHARRARRAHGRGAARGALHPGAGRRVRAAARELGVHRRRARRARAGRAHAARCSVCRAARGARPACRSVTARTAACRHRPATPERLNQTSFAAPRGLLAGAQLRQKVGP